MIGGRDRARRGDVLTLFVIAGQVSDESTDANATIPQTTQSSQTTETTQTTPVVPTAPPDPTVPTVPTTTDDGSETP